MTTSVLVAMVWFILANVAGLLPSRDNHWTRAYFLIATGVPILGWVTYENGPIVGLVFLAGGASILRWPLIYLYRRVMSKPRLGSEGETE